MPIELAQDDAQDSKSPLPVTLPPGMKTLPPEYVVLRSGAQSPEIFRATSDEEAVSRMQREVRSGQTPIVHLYKLMSSELFLPHSETLTPLELKERLGAL